MDLGEEINSVRCRLSPVVPCDYQRSRFAPFWRELRLEVQVTEMGGRNGAM